MKIEITQPQGKRPRLVTNHCMDCRKELGQDEGIETCSHTERYLLLCEECYTKRGSEVR